MTKFLLPSIVAISIATSLVSAADAPKPLKVLLFTGGCCHDYAKQKDILKEGIEKRANVIVDQVHTADDGSKFHFAEYEKPDWAKGYDVVIHDECAAGVEEAPFIEGILNAHKNGVPGVNLHCAMHSYRIGKPSEPVTDMAAPHALWFNYLGLQSSGHGAQKPIAIAFSKIDHPITKGMADWTTVNEELYNNVKVWDDTVVLARGKQGDATQDDGNVIIWTHEYGPKKTRVFSTTLGHNNATVEDDRYLELVTRGVLWAAGKLGADGKALPGYGK